MKWTEPASEQKIASSPYNIVSHRNAGRLFSAFLRYSTLKRRLENSGNRTSNNQVLFMQNNENKFAVHQAKKIRSNITREELTAIQTQLAILSDGDGDRPIHIAVANENLKLVHKLCVLMVRNSIPLDIRNYLRQTPLHVAVMLGNSDIIKLLLHYGASSVVCDRNGNSILHLAVKSNCSKDVLDTLLCHAQGKTVLNSMDYEGYSPLHYAVFKNNPNAVQTLQNFGADVNKIDGKSGRTALIHAVLEQNTDMVETLLNCGACPQKMDYSGRSALEMALQIGNLHIVSILEKRMPHSEVTAVKEQVKSPIQCCAKAKRTKNHN